MSDAEVLLNKIMILYLLKRVTFPMSNAELWSYFSTKDTISEASFQETVLSLEEANLIHGEELNSVLRYELTKEGDEALFYFKGDIPREKVDSLEDYVIANKFRLRNETGVSTSIDKAEDGEYYVQLKVREGKTTLFEMRLAVPTEEQASVLAGHLEENAQQIYSYVLRKVI